ncbi:hypothetical protein HHI36_012387 [Cryptolaemus montrouzieri]|uniref:1-acyl-sn-glycerol-3-phosphate acyltransferase n=1 Tax=Cryptolaemus montrouzieri TaxID=559131 RepID=A0ABD2NEW8_9CUCU
MKYLVFVFICSVIAILLLPVFLLRPRNVRNTILLGRPCQIVSSIIGIEWIIKGAENIPKDESCVIMSNHQSCLDAIGLFHVNPIFRRTTVVVKKELLYAIPFGTCLWLCGIIFLSRTHSEKSKHTLNDTLKTLKREKTNIWIYPEGTRRSDGRIHEFKKGGFHMALSAHLPILPVVYSAYDFVNHEEKKFGRGKVVITILPPISTKGKSMEDIESLMAETRNKMSETFQEINNLKMNKVEI